MAILAIKRRLGRFDYLRGRLPEGRPDNTEKLLMAKTRKAELPGAWSHAEIEDLLGHAGRLLETLDKGVRKIGAAAYPPKSNAAVFFLADVSSPLLEVRVRLRPDCFHLRFAANEPRKIYEGLELLDSVVDELTRLGFARSDLSTVPDVPANVFSWLETGIAWLRESIGRDGKKAAATGEGGKLSTPARRIGTNARMIDVISKQPEATGWTITQWAEKLGVVRSTIHDTRTWKNLRMGHLDAKTGRRKDWRRRNDKKPNKAG